LESENKSRQFS